MSVPGYKTYVVVGLMSVVAAILLSAVANADDPGSKTPLYVGVGAVGGFMVGLMGYQWIGMRGAGRSAKQNQILVTAISLAVIVGGALWVAGVDDVWRPFGEEGMGFPYAFAPVFVILAIALLTLPARLRSSVSEGNEQLRQHGLQITSLPRLVIIPGLGDSTHLMGATVLAGTRQGRRVEVVFEGGKHTVALAGAFPPDLVEDPRWGKLKPEVGPEGLRVKGRGSDWLPTVETAERIASGP